MSDHGNSFIGFRRPDGTVGVRNHILVLSTVALTNVAARRIARSVKGAVAVTTPYGRGQIGADAELHQRTLVGLGRNPNVGAVLVLGPDRHPVDQIAIAIAASGKPVEALSLMDVEEDALSLTDRGTRIGARLGRDISRLRQASAPVADLFVGVECGHSDATSGVVANPLAGLVADQIVDAGGRVVVGETLEWLGAEHVLTTRAVTPAVAASIAAMVAQRETEAQMAGIDLTGTNPGAENIAGGLSTIEEKSLGAISKGGQRPIRGALRSAEPPTQPGLYVMDTPYFSPESMTAMVAAGAQLLLFTTGAGNSVCNSLAPTIKLSANPLTARRLDEQIDFDASAVFAGVAHPPNAASRLFDLLLEVASGTLTFGEILDEGEEVISRVRASL